LKTRHLQELARGFASAGQLEALTQSRWLELPQQDQLPELPLPGQTTKRGMHAAEVQKL
jgi:hypothetical protein